MITLDERVLLLFNVRFIFDSLLLNLFRAVFVLFTLFIKFTTNITLDESFNNLLSLFLSSHDKDTILSSKSSESVRKGNLHFLYVC